MSQLALALGERSYNIYIQQGLLGSVNLFQKYCPGDKVLILSNQTVAPLYLEQLKTGLSGKSVFEYLIADGEEHKNLSSFSEILNFLVENGFRRNDTLIALGGGVIGDLGGFVAASYQRGMQLVQVPTTLLSQVDSSVGGKTAVNHRLGKNLIGAFYQPKAVVIDISTLQSLPEREFISGLAEVAKYALLGEDKIKQILQNQSALVLQRDRVILEQLILLSCAKKSKVVAQDEQEKGARALLNLGHSFGHAIEKMTEYRYYRHGEAVAIGMHMAINLALSKKLMTEELANEYKQLLCNLNLPDKVDKIIGPSEIRQAMKLDKKNLSDKYRLVLPTDKGCLIVEEDDIELIEQAIQKQLIS